MECEWLKKAFANGHQVPILAHDGKQQFKQLPGDNRRDTIVVELPGALGGVSSSGKLHKYS